jgi:regulatory protein
MQPEEEQSSFESYLSRAMFYCSKAERCPADLYQKFSQWKTPNEIWDDIIDRLKDENFLSEERFCFAFVKDKVLYNKWGFRKVEFALSQKQIKSSLVEIAIAEFDVNEYQNIVESELIKKNKSIREDDPFKRKAKLFNFAMSRGYESDHTSHIIEQLITKLT